MGSFDFLDNMGEPKSNFFKINTPKGIDDKIKYLEILKNRNLVMEEFGSELIELLLKKKINEEVFFNNVNKSIKLHNQIVLKIIGIDEGEFKFKNNVLEYVGAIDRMTDDKSTLNTNRGKVSYDFAKSLFEHLKGRRLKLEEINLLSDILDFKILKIFHVEQETK